jgi:hypothetical protein
MDKKTRRIMLATILRNSIIPRDSIRTIEERRWGDLQTQALMPGEILNLQIEFLRNGIPLNTENLLEAIKAFKESLQSNDKVKYIDMFNRTLLKQGFSKKFVEKGVAEQADKDFLKEQNSALLKLARIFPQVLDPNKTSGDNLLDAVWKEVAHRVSRDLSSIGDYDFSNEKQLGKNIGMTQASLTSILMPLVNWMNHKKGMQSALNDTHVKREFYSKAVDVTFKMIKAFSSPQLNKFLKEKLNISEPSHIFDFMKNNLNLDKSRVYVGQKETEEGKAAMPGEPKTPPAPKPTLTPRPPEPTASPVQKGARDPKSRDYNEIIMMYTAAKIMGANRAYPALDAYVDELIDARKLSKASGMHEMGLYGNLNKVRKIYKDFLKSGSKVAYKKGSVKAKDVGYEAPDPGIVKSTELHMKSNNYPFTPYSQDPTPTNKPGSSGTTQPTPSSSPSPSISKSPSASTEAGAGVPLFTKRPTPTRSPSPSKDPTQSPAPSQDPTSTPAPDPLEKEYEDLRNLIRLMYKENQLSEDERNDAFGMLSGPRTQEKLDSARSHIQEIRDIENGLKDFYLKVSSDNSLAPEHFLKLRHIVEKMGVKREARTKKNIEKLNEYLRRVKEGKGNENEVLRDMDGLEDEATPTPKPQPGPSTEELEKAYKELSDLVDLAYSEKELSKDEYDKIKSMFDNSPHTEENINKIVGYVQELAEGRKKQGQANNSTDTNQTTGNAGDADAAAEEAEEEEEEHAAEDANTPEQTETNYKMLKTLDDANSNRMNILKKLFRKYHDEYWYSMPESVHKTTDPKEDFLRFMARHIDIGQLKKFYNLDEDDEYPKEVIPTVRDSARLERYPKQEESTKTPEPTPTAEASKQPTPTPSPPPTNSPTPTVTQSQSRRPTPTVTQSQSRKPTPTVAPSTPVPTPTAEQSKSKQPTPTSSPPPTPTQKITQTPYDEGGDAEAAPDEDQPDQVSYEDYIKDPNAKVNYDMERYNMLQRKFGAMMWMFENLENKEVPKDVHDAMQDLIEDNLDKYVISEYYDDENKDKYYENFAKYLAEYVPYKEMILTLNGKSIYDRKRSFASRLMWGKRSYKRTQADNAEIKFLGGDDQYVTQAGVTKNWAESEIFTGPKSTPTPPPQGGDADADESTPTPEPSASQEQTTQPTPTQSPTPTITQQQTRSPEQSQTTQPTPTQSPTPTITQQQTRTPERSQSTQPTPTQSPTPTITQPPESGDAEEDDLTPEEMLKQLIEFKREILKNLIDGNNPDSKDGAFTQSVINRIQRVIDAKYKNFQESRYYDKNNYNADGDAVDSNAHISSLINYLIGQVPLNALKAILEDKDYHYTDADRQELKFINQEEEGEILIDEEKNKELFDSLRNFPDLFAEYLDYMDKTKATSDTPWGGINELERMNIENILIPARNAQVQTVKQWFKDIRDSHDPAERLIVKAIRKEAEYNDQKVFDMLNNRGLVWQSELNKRANDDSIGDTARLENFNKWYSGLSDEDKSTLDSAMKANGNFFSHKRGYFSSIPAMQALLEYTKGEQQQQQQPGGTPTPTPTMSPPPKSPTPTISPGPKSPTPTISPGPQSPTPTISPPPHTSPGPGSSPGPNTPTPTPQPNAGNAGGSGTGGGSETPEQQQIPTGPLRPGQMPIGERNGPQRRSSYRAQTEAERRRELEREKWGGQPDEQWYSNDPNASRGGGERDDDRRRKRRGENDGEDKDLFSSTGDPFSGLDFGKLPDDFGQYDDFRSYGEHRNTADGTEKQYTRLYQNNMNVFKKAMNDFQRGSGPANETMDQYQERIGAGIHPNREFGYTGNFSALGRGDYNPLREVTESNNPFGRGSRAGVKRRMKGRFTNRQANDILSQFYNNNYDSPAGLEDLIAAYAENKIGEDE